MITIPVTQSLASSPERKVAQILGPEVFEGISGGLDTLGEIIAHLLISGINCKTKQQCTNIPSKILDIYVYLFTYLHVVID